MRSNRASLRQRWMSGPKTFVRLLMLGMLCAVVVGCQSMTTLTTGIGGLEKGESSVPFCLAGKRITYSASRDTPETVAQVREHNAVGRALKCRDWR